jgi:anti-anti-sigma regulatory factor
MTMEKDVATGRWKLSGTLCIDDANSLREALLGCFADPGGVILDVGEVSECDTTGLQLLISAQRTAAAQGRDFCIEQPAEGPVNKLAQTLGLALEKGAGPC